MMLSTPISITTVIANVTQPLPGSTYSDAPAGCPRVSWSVAIAVVLSGAHSGSAGRSFPSQRRPARPPKGMITGSSAGRRRAQVHDRRLHPAVHVGVLGQAELREDPVHVAFDAAHRDPRDRGDAGVAVALGDQAQNVELAGRQMLEQPVRLVAADDQRADYRCIDVGPAGRDGLERTGQLLAVLHLLLEQVAAPFHAFLEQIHGV